MTPERLETFRRGDSIEVAPLEIERELAALWRQSSQAADKAVTRACLWNFIVQTGLDAGNRARAKQLVDEISKAVPTRAIVVHSDGRQAEDVAIRAWVEANWQGHSASEEVTLLAGGASAARVPSLVRSLLIADAPTALFWIGAPPEKAWRAEPLLSEIDRLIVDTRRLPHEESLFALDELATEMPELELVDLAWIGVRPMRGLCAALFDPPAGDPSVLEQLERVRVVSAVTGTQSRALLTLGWLGSRLGWHNHGALPVAADGTRRWSAARPDGGRVEIELGKRAEEPSHGVVEISLHAHGKRWALTRGEVISIEAPERPLRAQPMRRHSDGELATVALGARGRDPVFRDALHGAVQILGARA